MRAIEERSSERVGGVPNARRRSLPAKFGVAQGAYAGITIGGQSEKARYRSQAWQVFLAFA
jgi:hypothetical protein|uniref:ID764 n=1 Tax=Bradyrhizobium japonicum TaxID=375 RepID=Q9AMX4_BRAJP|nr:ID764 [Bradyrhizobium japonicum]